MNSRIEEIRTKMADLQKELDEAKAEEAENWGIFRQYKLNRNYKDTGWLAFILTNGIRFYRVEAKVYDEPSDYGIYGGRVSKLNIRDKETGDYIFFYDRGLDQGDADEILAEIANAKAIALADKLS